MMHKKQSKRKLFFKKIRKNLIKEMMTEDNCEENELENSKELIEALESGTSGDKDWNS
ncbi:MAG: hypothetical protein IIT81_02005 [Mycoplasmataceae bacterium]|nr:hypothetical protein [Mycoplasmataceae bacterium]